jgi:hypothetical protein
MKAIKVTLLTAILTMVFCLPVMAQEVTDPTKVYKEDAFNIDEQKLIDDFHKGEVWRCENYVKYLDGVIFNLNETARIKKEVVTNYTELAKVNPYFNTLLPNAIKDYTEAVAWVDAYKAYRQAVQADLKIRYNY